MKTYAKLTAAAAAVAMLTSGAALAGISTTKHNMAANNGQATYVTAGTTEICVFCHTPHGSDTSAPVPLWNKRLPTGGSYATYASLGTTTLDASSAQIGSVSLACLSCHDGTQAMDNIINAPGSGGYASDGSGANGRNFTWTSNDAIGGGTVASPAGTPIPNLGTDLTNDHPVSIQYAGGGTQNGAAVDTDFNAAVSSGTQYWINVTGGTASREKSDMILYNRTDATAWTGATTLSGTRQYVECATCHDPHSTNTTFLRTDNAGSTVCLACHNK